MGIMRLILAKGLPSIKACSVSPWWAQATIGTRAPMLVLMEPDERWSLDLVSDQLTVGRRFRLLTVCR